MANSFQKLTAMLYLALSIIIISGTYYKYKTEVDDINLYLNYKGIEELFRLLGIHKIINVLKKYFVEISTVLVLLSLVLFFFALHYANKKKTPFAFKLSLFLLVTCLFIYSIFIFILIKRIRDVLEDRLINLLYRGSIAYLVISQIILLSTFTQLFL